MQLRLERVARRVKLQDLAKQMRRSRATVHRYEGLESVPVEVVQDYRGALATFSEDATSATTEQAA